MRVTITLDAVDSKFPGGTVAGNWRIEARNPDASLAAEYEGPDPTTDLNLTEGNSYTLRGWRLSDSHDTLGSVAEMTGFVVGGDLVVISTASGIAAKSWPDGMAAR